MKKREYDTEVESDDGITQIAYVFLERFEALVDAVDQNTEVQKKILKVFNKQYDLLRSRVRK